MRGGVGVVPAGEVAVVGRDDGVLLSLLHVLPEEGGTQTGSARWLSGHCYTVRSDIKHDWFVLPGTNQHESNMSGLFWVHCTDWLLLNWSGTSSPTVSELQGRSTCLRYSERVKLQKGTLISIVMSIVAFFRGRSTLC